ncbi:ice-structuring protein 4-like isoform X2 [Ursus arctos]|uniref:ice-structuring protein 4-like isoform X2 n=2 Tax=Ursus arctos TaxID=9644 RepID=UPI00254910C5|nr:ice-structuring protein 4-like isoform X2 [Ursus arctos]
MRGPRLRSTARGRKPAAAAAATAAAAAGAAAASAAAATAAAAGTAAAAAGSAVRPRREALEGAPPVGSRRRLAVVCPRLPAPRAVHVLYWTLQGDNWMRNDPLQKVFAAEGGRRRSQSVMMVQWVL